MLCVVQFVAQISFSCVLPLSLCLYICTVCFCLCVFWCVCTSLSECLVCFVSLQSADKDAMPAQLFPACLPPWRLQLQASTSPPTPSPPFPALFARSFIWAVPSPPTPIQTPLLTSPFPHLPHVPHYPVTQLPSLASSMPLTLCFSFTLIHLPPFCSLLLMLKTQNITLSDNTQTITCFVKRGTVWLRKPSQPENRLSQT